MMKFLGGSSHSYKITAGSVSGGFSDLLTVKGRSNYICKPGMMENPDLELFVRT